MKDFFKTLLAIYGGMFTFFIDITLAVLIVVFLTNLLGDTNLFSLSLYISIWMSGLIYSFYDFIKIYNNIKNG